MKKFYFRFGVFMVTLALGSVTGWVFSNNSTIDSDEIEIPAIAIDAPKEPKFTETFRGCKPGYTQGYVTDDGYELTEGNCKNPDKSGGTVVQNDDQRIVSQIEFNGTTYFQIYQLKSGACIYSPTIELGIALENHIKNEELKHRQRWEEAEMSAKKPEARSREKK